MEQVLLLKILLIDLGHPMNADTVKTMKASLLNAIFLKSIFSANNNLTTFGIFFVNSKQSVIANLKSIQKQYTSFCEVLSNLIDSNYFKAASNGKITIQQYKIDLKASLNNIQQECDVLIQKLKANNKSYAHDSTTRILLYILTKKAAPFLNIILKNTFTKLVKERGNTDGLLSLFDFKIIQISNEPTPNGINKEPPDFIICGNNSEDLNIILKTFMFQSEYERKHLEIFLSKDSVIKCLLEDCTIFSAFLGIGKDSFGLIVQQFLDQPDILAKLRIKVLFRVPLSGMRPTMLFGFPRRVYADSNQFSSKENEFNHQMYEALCKELTQNKEGLLAQSFFPTINLKIHYFLTTDGNALLLNCTIPEELYLTEQSEYFKEHFKDHGKAGSLMRNTLSKIQVLMTYAPTKFPAGYYHFTNSTQKDEKNFEHNELAIKEEINILKDIRHKSSQYVCNKCKKKKSKSKRKNTTKIHPALLSPKTVRKYRKYSSVSYELPELNPEKYEI